MAPSLHARGSKEPDAQWVNAFRPITVLSLPYRCWASLRCRQLIRWITATAPDTLIGNRPGKSTADLWFTIQAQIEEQHYNGGALSGVLTDIVKCYNMIPRLPTLVVLFRAGSTPPITLNRRSTCTSADPAGFPEGCSLSVCSMLLLNVACTYYIEHASLQATYWSYVDNLEATGPTGESAKSSLGAMQKVCHQLDLALDDKKTFLWSTCPQTRKELREEGYQVAMQLRDIGGPHAVLP